MKTLKNLLSPSPKGIKGLILQLYTLVLKIQKNHMENPGPYSCHDFPPRSTKAWAAIIHHPFCAFFASYIGVKLYWKFQWVEAGDHSKYVKSFMVVGEEDRCKLYIHILIHISLSLYNEYQADRKIQSTSKRYNNNHASVFFRANLDSFLEELQLKLAYTSKPKTDTLEVYIMNNLPLDYKNYRFKHGKMYQNAISKKFYARRVAN